MSKTKLIEKQKSNSEGKGEDDPLAGVDGERPFVMERIKNAPDSYSERMRQMYSNSNRWVNQTNRL